MSHQAAAYALISDFTRQRGTSCKIHLVEFPGWSDLNWWGTAPMDLPDPVVYTVGNRRVHMLTDKPATVWLNPVFSQRMLDALFSVKPFGYRRYAVELRCGGKILHPPSPDLAYWLVQLTEHFDGFDPERSDWEPDERMPWHIEELYRLELKIPPEGLPPIFRIPQQPTTLFVSAEGREALIAAGIRGVEFKSCLELTAQRYKQARIEEGKYRPPPTSRPS